MGCGSLIPSDQSTLHPFKNPADFNVEESAEGCSYRGKDPIQKSSYYLDCNDRLIQVTPKVTRMYKNIDVHISAKSDVKTSYVSKLSLCEVAAHYKKKSESPTKIDTEYWPMEKTVGGIITITLDNNSTYSGNLEKESSSAAKIETELNPRNWQPQTVFPDTNLTPKIVEQMRKLVNTDNPEVQAAAKERLEIITKPITLCKRQKHHVAPRSKSLDLNIGVNKMNVKRITELESDLDVFDCNLSRAEGEQIPQYENSKLLGSERGNESILSISENVSAASESMLIYRGDEKMEGSPIDIVDFSKRQVIRGKRQSIRMSRLLDDMPSLSLSLTNDRRLNLEKSSNNRGYAISQELKDIGLQLMCAEIDELDAKIQKCTQKLTKLRVRSLDLLTDWIDSGESQNGKDRDSDQNGEEGNSGIDLKDISFVSLEKEIDRWQDHKNKLVDERSHIITKLNSKLINQINSNSLTASPNQNKFCHAGDALVVTLSDTEMESSFK